MDRGSWRATVHSVADSDMTEIERDENDRNYTI